MIKRFLFLLNTFYRLTIRNLGYWGYLTNFFAFFALGKDFSSIADSVLLAFQSMAVYKTRNDVKNRSIHSPYLKNETFCNKAVADPDLQISKGGVIQTLR